MGYPPPEPYDICITPPILWVDDRNPAPKKACNDSNPLQVATNNMVSTTVSFRDSISGFRNQQQYLNVGDSHQWGLGGMEGRGREPNKKPY